MEFPMYKKAESYRVISGKKVTEEKVELFAPHVYPNIPCNAKVGDKALKFLKSIQAEVVDDYILDEEKAVQLMFDLAEQDMREHHEEIEKVMKSGDPMSFLQAISLIPQYAEEDTNTLATMCRWVDVALYEEMNVQIPEKFKEAYDVTLREGGDLILDSYKRSRAWRLEPCTEEKECTKK